jgi:hypothetical protein
MVVAAKLQTESLRTLFDRLVPGTSLRAISNGCGVTTKTVRKLLRGDGKEPFRGTILLLAMWLRCPPSRVADAIEASRKT